MHFKKFLLPALSLFIFSNTQAQEKSNYGRTTIAVSPLQLSAPGVGFGLSYERDLDKEGIVALYIPAALTFASRYRDYYYYYSYNSSIKYHTGYFMPGLKFYPTGSKGKIKYGVGPNLAFVLGERPYLDNNPNIQPYPYYYSYSYSMRTRFSFGTMIFNSLNINPTPHLHIGVEMGLGVSYIDQTNGVNTGAMPFLFQFGTQLGYRF